MALVQFQHQAVSLDVNEVRFEEEQDIPNTPVKFKALLNGVDVGNENIMHPNVEYLRCGEVEALGYFQLSEMRYDDRNVVIKRVSTTVLQLYLI